MDDDSRYLRLISGRSRGVGASAGRAGLRALETVYKAIIASRNAWYDRWAIPTWLDIPVISLGNLTVGGTGKTPMALWLCERLIARGLKPAVLSRGYRASQEGMADEMLVVARRCAEAVAVANPDRVAAGEMAIREYGAQVAILDDGFQHRRIGRELDIVLIDATRPYGYGHVLPRGLLREPVSSLRRADAVVLTRIDQCPPADLKALESEAARLAPALPVLRATHRPAGLVDLRGQPVETPPGERLGCFAGIARPQSFQYTLREFGLDCVSVMWWPDHHPYSVEDGDRILAWARSERLDGLITTEKDAVKLAGLGLDWPVPVAVLRIELSFPEADEARIEKLIDAVLRDHAEQLEAEPAAAATPVDDEPPDDASAFEETGPESVDDDEA
jgi:tetraacyldisaccharide 4'-kinase